jgi:hypothetical protein
MTTGLRPDPGIQCGSGRVRSGGFRRSPANQFEAITGTPWTPAGARSSGADLFSAIGLSRAVRVFR